MSEDAKELVDRLERLSQVSRDNSMVMRGADAEARSWQTLRLRQVRTELCEHIEAHLAEITTALRSYQSMKEENERLREALEAVEAKAKQAQSFYDRNGPELTSSLTGAELYEADTFLAAHEEYG